VDLQQLLDQDLGMGLGLMLQILDQARAHSPLAYACLLMVFN
jgi:hypothetical protein